MEDPYLPPPSHGLEAWLERAHATAEHQWAVPLADTARPLVGREQECALLWRQFEAAARGHAGVVLVAGEPGIGKTRLLEEFAQRAADAGACVLRGSTSRTPDMPPYLPFLEALGQYLQAAPTELLASQVGDLAAPLASIFPELAGSLTDSSASRALPTEQARLRLFEAIGSLLQRIGLASPVVLLLHELHGADSASLDLLYFIARRQSSARLLLVGSYREDELHQNLALERLVAELNRLRLLTVVRLDRLSQPEIAALAEHFLGQPLSAAASRLLYTQSEGNPFFAEEILRGWIETDVLAHDSTTTALVTRLESRLPAGIVTALRQRLARLAPEKSQYLQVAAVIGRAFSPALLARVLGEDVEAVEEGLLEARRSQVIRPYRGERLVFSHDKLREWLYSELGASRRQRLHERIGRALEQAVTAEPQLAELALHFARAGDRARALTYSLRAADAALAACAPAEAASHYRAALELLDPNDPRRGDLLLRLGDTTLAAGLEREAVTVYERAQEWGEHASARVFAARAARGLGLAHWRLGALPAARVALETALRLQGHRAEPDVVRTLVDLAVLLGIDLGEQTEAIVLGYQALEFARQLGDDRLEAAASRIIGNLLVRENDITTGIHLLERALALAQTHDDQSEVAACCAGLGQAYVWLADFTRAIAIGLRREAVARQRHDQLHTRYSYSWLAFLRACQGDWREAERFLGQAWPFVEHEPDSEPAAFWHQIRGFLAYQQGEYATAIQELHAATTSFRQRHPEEFALCLGPLARALYAAGNVDEARARVTELEGLVTTIAANRLLAPDNLVTGTAVSSLAELAVAMGDRQRAATYYPQLLAFTGQYHWSLVDGILGALAIQQEAWPAAEAHLRQAETIAQREGLRPEQARLLVLRADLLLARGGPGSATRARDQLGMALRLFQELGITAEASATRERLRTLPRQPGAPVARRLPGGLSERELRVLRLVAVGKSNRQIAEELFLSEKTVANHLTSIFNKTGTENRTGATAFALRHALV